MPTELERAAEILATAEKVMVTCHLGPDGDSVGSMVAMTSLLRQRAAQVTLYNPDLVPRYLKWLPLCKGVVHRLPRAAAFDATVVMDCGDAKLLGPDFPGPEVTGKLVVIDHHASGRPFGDVFLCDPDASSVGVIVARLAGRLGWALTEEAALALYVSLVTDTGSFRYANTNAEALRLAAELVERHGVGPWAVSERLSEQGTLGRYRLLSATLATLEPTLGGHVVFMTITEEAALALYVSLVTDTGSFRYA
ncbi:MAG TPA: DHH family phosphoesterase, partial [Candidatus Acidoferrum sp.]|nr:DHH family phosphoesterase [Candidatus Acidoferrum sp.]